MTIRRDANKPFGIADQIHTWDSFAVLLLAAIWVSIRYGGVGPSIPGIVLSTLLHTTFLHLSSGWMQIASNHLPSFCLVLLFTFLIWHFGRGERKRTEAKLEMFSSIVQNSPDFIGVADMDSNAVFVNRAGQQMFGLDGDREVMQTHPLDYFADGQRATVREELIPLLLERGELSVEVPAKSFSTGKSFPVLWTAFVIYDQKTKKPSFLAGVAKDITEHKRIEQELRRRDAYLTEAQRISNTGSWAWNATTKEGFWSEEILCILGLDSESAQPSLSAYCERVHRDDVTELKMLWHKAVEQKTEIDHRHRILRPDGSVRHTRLRGWPFPMENGVDEMLGILMDVTEQHQDREALQKSLRDNEALLEQNQFLQEKLRRENVSLQELNFALQGEIADIQRNKFEKIIGGSPALQRTLHKVEQVAATDATVLITGETGTGKELIAQAIHERSKRARVPFRSINCAALPATLMAAELFGHEKGAFTGADRQRVGQFELGVGGTLFLDEIAEISIDMQATLLRVLEEHSFQRLGGTKLIPADVRVIAATNRDLHVAMRAGEFRQDLFYRLNSFPIELPPLRERREDIPILVNHFIEISAARHGKTIRNIEKRGMELLRSYDWPGNIRELRNVIDTSVIVSAGEVISIDEGLLCGTWPAGDGPIGSLQKEIANHERILIERALTEAQGRVSGPAGAAMILHLPPSTLSAKMKTLKIVPSKFKARQV
jgi:PAS domain S-box-containing protein